MKRSTVGMAIEFRVHWRHYISQSLLATVVLYVVMLYLGLSESVIIASIGATAYIVFALPQKLIAQPVNVIGGHLVGVIIGAVSAVVLRYVPEGDYIPSLIYAFSVGFSMFIMVAIDVEHPAAAGTALGIAINGFSWKVAMTVMVSAIILSLIHYFAKSYLRDLE